MKELLIIRLNSIEKVKKFAKIANQHNFNIELIQGNYSIDGKSIMGLFSLDLSKELVLRFDSDNEDDSKKFLLDMEEFHDYSDSGSIR